MPRSYLEKILRARVYDVAIETPLDPAKRLSERLENNVLLKREDMQPVFSFKLRGAYNKLYGLTDEQRKLLDEISPKSMGETRKERLSNEDKIAFYQMINEVHKNLGTKDQVEFWNKYAKDIPYRLKGQYKKD